MSIVRTAPADPKGRTRRIAVVNSNSSSAVTRQLADTVEPALLPGTEALFVNPERGPAGIDTRLDAAIAAAEGALLIRDIAGEVDAVVLACGNDPGLAAARETTDRPVVGIAEAGFLQACAFAPRFSVAVLAPRKIADMRRLIDGYGLRGRLASVVAAESSSRAAASAPGELLDQLIRTCDGLGDDDLGDALVLTGSVMGRIAPDLSAAIGRPVVSGLLAGVRLAETLADARIIGRPTAPVHPKEDS